MTRVLTTLLVLLAATFPPAEAHHRLPLGSPSLHEARTTDVLAPGVKYTRIVRGEASPRDGWTVDVAVLAARDEAFALARRLRTAEEEAAVMRALGARDAVNLDGGGSTTMTIRGSMVTRPSDATGERPIGDAILVAASGR
jgi:Phosphodiester glycosidase